MDFHKHCSWKQELKKAFTLNTCPGKESKGGAGMANRIEP